MFLSSCLFVLALAAINSLTFNSYTTASDLRGIHTNAENRLPESKSESTSHGLNFCISLIQQEVKTTVVVPRKHQSGSGILLPRCKSGYASHPSETLWKNSSTARHYILIYHRTFFSQKKERIPFAFLLRKGKQFSHVCDELHTTFLISSFSSSIFFLY